jgi:nitroreductase/dihydropteridine reductase
MSSFIEHFQKRYTTKKYDSSRKIHPTILEELKQVVRLSPSSINSQPWHFTFVSDDQTKQQLAAASLFNDKKVLDSDTVVVFSRIDNIGFFEQQIQENLPEGAVAYYNNMIKPLPENEIKAWFDKQVYLALGVFLSACSQLSIDATPMEGIEPEKYNAILGHSNHHALVAVAVGFRAEDDSNQPRVKPKSRVAADKIITTV